MLKKKQRDKKVLDDQSPQGLASATANLFEPLLAVHASRNTGWLADACSTAAERGLGALYSILYLTDPSGLLAGQRPSSSERVRSLGRLNERFEADLTTLRFRATDRTAMSGALADGHAVAVQDLGEALPLSSDALDIREAQRRLGIAQLWLAPLYWDGQATGVLVLFIPANTPASLEDAEVLGRHAAVAYANMRDMEAQRKWGELDTIRLVYDEQRFFNQLSTEIRRAERHGRPLSVMFLRIQNLADLRSRYGRFLADGLMRELGVKFAEAIRDTDFLGAYGEDSFATILVEAGEKSAVRARERLLGNLASISLPDASLPGLNMNLVSAIATLAVDGNTAEELVEAGEAHLRQETERVDKVA